MNPNDYDAQRAAHIAHLDALKRDAQDAKAKDDPVRTKRLNVQISQVELILRHEFPKRRHDPTTLPDYFLIACQKRLPPEQFSGLIEAAKRLQAAEQKAEV
jgi:hypothetical protein